MTGYLYSFAISDVNYMGPLLIKESCHRGQVDIFKVYIALFICFNTKATHLESDTFRIGYRGLQQKHL